MQGKGTKAVKRGSRAWKLAVNRWLRLAIQLVFLVLAPGAFSAGFNGVKYLFTQIGSIAALQFSSFLVTLVVLLAFTVVFGRFFCGYACSFGMLGDVVFQLVDAGCGKLGLKHPVIPEKAMRVLSLGKFAMLVAICVLCLTGAWTAVSGYSPWEAFGGLTSGSVSGIQAGAFVCLGLCVVGMAFSERFFCRVLCPLGAVFSLMPMLPFTSFTRVKEHCASKCGRCQGACPVGVWPDEDSIAHGECISCGRCALSCPMGNVNFVAIEKRKPVSAADGPTAGFASASGLATEFASASGSATEPPSASSAVTCAPARVAAAEGDAASSSASVPSKRRPRPKTRAGWHLVCGAEPVVVIVQALVLLGCCWAIGLVRYLPSLSSLFS